MPMETYEVLQTVCGDEVLSFSRYLNGSKDLKMVQEAGVLQPLEIQTQSQMSVKWWNEIVDGLSE
jgi:hypothetical protein